MSYSEDRPKAAINMATIEPKLMPKVEMIPALGPYRKL